MGELHSRASSARSRGVVLRGLFTAALTASCAGSSGPSVNQMVAAESEAANDRTLSRIVSTVLGDPEGASPSGPLSGAAARAPERPVPEDITGLSSRMSARALPIPAAAAGETARFTFAGYRRGWFVRVPGGSQALLTPAYGNGKIFLGGGFSSAHFYAYDARSGDPLWTTVASDGGPTAAILEDDKVLFNTESCTLFAVNASTGQHLWRRWLGDPLMGQPAANSDTVFSGHVIDGRSPGRIRRGQTGWGVAGGRVYGFTALRLRDGRPRWTRRISADVMNGPVLDGRSVFFTTMDGAVHHLDQRSGRTRWHRNLHATSAPWLHGDEVHVTAQADAPDEASRGRSEQTRSEQTLVLSRRRGETLHALDPVDAGFLNARADAGGVARGWAYEGSRPTVHDGRSFQTIGNEVHCRDAASGQLLWRREYTDDASSRPASPPAVAGSQLIFGTRDGKLFGLDADTGITTWAYDVGEPISAQPTVAHGWVYAATTRSGLLGIEVADASLDGWHMWGGNASHSGPTLGTTAPLEDTSRPSEGTLRLDDEPNEGELAGFPIQNTDVRVSLTGFVAHVRVEQRYQNPFERPVEASYLFPVPEGAAVDGMEMRAGGRVVRAEMRPRDAGGTSGGGAGERTVSILEQERPDLFRQTLRNIAPSETLSVVLEYTQVLPYEDGAYRFTYPLAAGSRYTRDDGTGYNPAGTPLELELEPGDERPDGVTIRIDADVGTDLSAVRSTTHELDVTTDGGSFDGGARARVELRGAAPPDRDLDVRFEVGDEDGAGVALVASPPSGHEAGTFAMALHPRMRPSDEEIIDRELVLVVDTSRSMRGLAMERARAAMIRTLSDLRATDTFRVVGLDGPLDGIASEVLAASPTNVARARAGLSRLRATRADGSRAGLHSVLASPEVERLRVIALFTDGYFASEREIFAEVERGIGDARLFAFGVGATVNQYLLTRLTERGRGALQVIGLDVAPDVAAERFASRIGRPTLTDLQIEWGEMDIHDAYPRRLPDLFADRPLIIHGRYRAGGDGRVVLRGRVGGRTFTQTIDITLPEEGRVRPELTSAWVRTRISDLETAMALAPSASLRQEVVELAVSHHILTPWTRFVAIDTVERPPSALLAEAAEAEAAETGRPTRDVDPSIATCYAQARGEDGEIETTALAQCLAAHAP